MDESLCVAYDLKHQIENLPDEFSFAQAGAAEVIYRTDFDDRIDINIIL